VLAVYEHTAGITVLSADHEGKILSEDALEGTYRSDVGAKHMLAPVEPAPGGSYILSWAYRQVREYELACRRPGSPVPVWKSPEFLLAANTELVFGMTTPREESRLVCRAKADGRELWAIEGQDLLVARASDRNLYVVDRGARLAERRAADASAEEAFLASEEGDRGALARYEAARAPMPRTPTRVRVVDVLTGRDRCGVDVEGDVIDVAASPDDQALSIVSSTPEGRGLLAHHASEDGARLGGTTVVPGRQLATWPPSEERGPCILARGIWHIILATEDEMWCYDAPGAERWALPLPAPCRGFRPRMVDRLLPLMNAAYVPGRLFLRRGQKLWTFESARP
jgi:hypothetical protein